MRAAGHQIGNRTYSHETPFGRMSDPAEVLRELETTDALVRQVDDRPRLFRPVGGGGELGPHLSSPEAASWLEAREVTCALWTSVPGDWKDPEGWPEQALADCAAQDEVLMVLHDASPDGMTRLEATLDRLEAEGHELVPELPARCLPMVNGVKKPDFDRYVTPR